MSLRYLASMAGLGLLGFDPAIAVVAVASLIGGVRAQVAGWFVGTALLGTWALAIVLALTAGRAVAGVDWHRLLRTGPWPASVEAAAALAGMAWVAVRLRRTTPVPAERTAHGVVGGIGLALVLVAAWVVDPGFVGGVVAAGRTGSVLAVVIGATVWLLVAQSLTVIVGLTLLTSARTATAGRLEAVWFRVDPYRRMGLTVVIGLVALAVAVDACCYAVGGRYLIG